MEDRYLVQFPFMESSAGSKRALLAVFDGHAGKECAIAAVEAFPQVLLSFSFILFNDCCSELFLQEFQKHLSQALNLTDLSDIFTKTYLSLDEQLRKYEYQGSTATTAFIWEHQGVRYLQCANVGDSTSFVKNGNTITRLSIGEWQLLLWFVD